MAQDREPKSTDKEKINLEIYAERQNDLAERERYMELARGETLSQEHEVASRGQTGGKVSKSQSLLLSLRTDRALVGRTELGLYAHELTFVLCR
jgi:hypothetical protein